MDDKLFWGFLFGTASTAIGWSLNQVGQMMSVRIEDKKKLKTVLYHLLEVHNLFLRSDFEEFLKKIKDRLRLLIPKEEFTPQAEVFLTTTLSAFANKLIADDILNSFKQLESGYQDSIRNLSSVEPLIAYRLSGKTSIYGAIEELFSQVSGLSETFQTDKEKFNSEIKQIVDIVKPDFNNKIIETLELDILHIARMISFVTWWRLRTNLKTYREKTNAEMDKQIDSLFKKFEPMLKQ